MSPRETPRQAKVRRMAARYADRFHPGPSATFTLMLAGFGLEVWQAARRQAIRELTGTRRARARLVERARKAGL